MYFTEHVVSTVHTDSEQRIKPLIEEIVQSVCTTEDEAGAFYRRIVQYIILVNYMGNPVSPSCIKETADALNIVFKQSDVRNFENLPTTAKQYKLNELTRMVCGIRLYESDRKASKEGILDLVETLPKAVDLLLRHLDQSDCGKAIATLTSRIRQCYRVDDDTLAPLFSVRTSLTTVGNADLLKYKMILAFYHQYATGLKIIESDLVRCQEQLPALINEYNATMEKINTNMKNATTMGTDLSKFNIKTELMAVSKVWDEMIATMNYLSVTTNIIMTMKCLARKINDKTARLNVTESSQSVVNELFPVVGEQRQREMVEKHSLHPMCTWYPPSSNVDRTSLFADGYCIVMLVETDGTLMKHDRRIGFINYCDELFGFTCIQAALHFGTKPEHYKNCFVNLLRSQTHLLLFFHMYEQVVNLPYTTAEQMHYNYRTAKYKNAQVQYDMTIVQSFPLGKPEICQNRRAPKLISIAEMTTRSVQTQDTVQVQTVSCTDVGVNTMKEKSTNTKPYGTAMYDDTDDLAYSSRIVLPSKNWMHKFKDEKQITMIH
ncbi:cilia- and flagella-associated protein 206-like isoform X2 [Adelges cooleyi]|uniref:cilia- and flagella-associated protein 206-like isoform X2 n=1 Tax=Adelges cooleyi TaxID=133065 RepID=UPI0021805C35|nr:cilia- and flagella-associated protein 206-like isoform X2 [Adelges cooleyi]